MKVEQLNAKNPEIDRDALKRRNALFFGGQRWRDLLDTWLPKRPSEPPDSVSERHDLATYVNDVASLISLVPAYLFSEPLSLGATLPWWDDWGKNVDHRGHKLSAWASMATTKALVEGEAWCWVNLPRRDVEVETRAQQDDLGQREAYLVLISTEQILDWSVDEHDELLWVVFGDSVRVREFGEDAKTVRRWTYIDRTKIRRWTTDKDSSEEATEVLPEVKHNLGIVPVVRWKLPHELCAMAALEDPATSLIRARNARSWGVYQSAYATLAIYTDRDIRGIVAGEGYYVQLPGDSKAGYLEPSGSGLTAQKEEVDRCLADLYRAMRQMMLGARSDALQAQSGLSKAEDWRALELTLSTYADEVRGFIGRVVRMVATVRGEPDTEFELTGMNGWQQETLEELLQAISQGGELMRRSPTAAAELLAKLSQALLGDDAEALKVIRGELDTWDPSSDPMMLTGRTR